MWAGAISLLYRVTATDAKATAMPRNILPRYSMGRLKAAHVMTTPMSKRIPAINIVVFRPYFLHASGPVFSTGQAICAAMMSQLSTSVGPMLLWGSDFMQARQTIVTLCKQAVQPRSSGTVAHAKGGSLGDMPCRKSSKDASNEEG